MKNDVIKLVTEVARRDADGFQTTDKLENTVFAEIASVKRAEYYNASALGITVQITATINYDDYVAVKNLHGKKPTLVFFDDCYYKIVRTYRKKVENDMELTLTEVEHE